MSGKSVNDNRAAGYVIAAVIAIAASMYAPVVAIAELYDTNISAAMEVFLGKSIFSLEVERLSQVMHLAAITFLIVMAIVTDVSRRKQPLPHRKSYAIAIVIILAAILIHVEAAAGFWSPSVIIRRYEKIEIWSAYVTKSAHTYTVTISFVNVGDSRTSIDSVLLNGIRYDDRDWAGTLTLAVSGDLTSESIIEVLGSYSGTITFSDDCTYVPSGIKLMAGSKVTVTILTTGRRVYINTYNASVIIP